MNRSDVKPKKSFGQHFLKNTSIANHISVSIQNTPDFVIEVGPGTGVLTQFLMQQYPENFAVAEIDRESIAYLKIHYPNLDIIEGDFLRLDLSEYGSKVAIIGNFPYNISTEILFKCLDYKENVVEMVGMFQKEVADRVVSKEGSKVYGIISVLLQAFFDVEYLFTVEAEEFIPPPKVRSAVIRLRRNGVTDLGCDPKLFKTVVKLAFNQRRKMLSNALKSLAETSTLPYMNKRAEQLSVAQFIELTQAIEHLQN
jgi:16S rRNA (adenine1518-N6/adenine1519-N6)-dimethyltransferase